jgi:hypothetical protein
LVEVEEKKKEKPIERAIDDANSATSKRPFNGAAVYELSLPWSAE